MKSKRDEENYGTGFDDGLEPLVPLDVGRLDSVNALVSAMANTAFGGRRLGEAADVLEAMVRDPNCFRVVTISGAMTIAKQGLVLCEMIDRGWVQAIVTTGALMTHGLSEGVGMLHFKHRASMPDTELYDKGYNRVYDTIELEQNLDDVEGILEEALADLPEDVTLSSHLICERLGRTLEKSGAERAILKSAFQRKVPVFVPAFVDRMFDLLGDFDVAVPFDGHRHHPLAAVYCLSVLPQIQTLIDSGQLRLTLLFGEVHTREIPVQELRAVDPQLATLKNVNCDNDYMAALIEAGLTSDGMPARTIY